MSNTVVKVENVSKQYRLGIVGTSTIKDDLSKWWHTSVLGRENPLLKIGEANDRTTKGGSDYVWSLRDINFEIKQGEVFSIIGKNGAGKSTLLKILSKVTAPTTGNIKVKGKISSLLEVGTGFHPELTGRENIYLNGAILGMRKKEIAKKFDEIVDFSGVERYIDTPVKRYSSGMYVRLAFAVAAHLESEILILDEVLAVGDADFQKKCLGKMSDVSKSEGRTIIFVSHNMAAVKSLCTNGLVLESGTIKLISNNIEDCIGSYLGNKKDAQQEYEKNYDINDSKFGNESLRLLSCKIIKQENEKYLSVKSGFNIGFHFAIYKPFENFNLSVCVRCLSDNAIVFNQISNFTKINKGEYYAEMIIPPNFFNALNYTLDLYLVNNFKTELLIQNIIKFEVVDERNGIDYYGSWPGYIRPNLPFQIK